MNEDENARRNEFLGGTSNYNYRSAYLHQAAIEPINLAVAQLKLCLVLDLA